MKRALTFLVSWFCVLAVFASGLAAPSPLTEADFVLTLDGTQYRLGEAAAPLLAQAEAAFGPFQEQSADSCMFTGKDKEFENDALLIATYPIGPKGADVVETIFVLDEGIVTPRGIGVGSPKAEVLAAYGDGFTLDYDQMIYGMGDAWAEPILVFVLDLTTDCVSSFYLMRNTTNQ